MVTSLTTCVFFKTVFMPDRTRVVAPPLQRFLGGVAVLGGVTGRPEFIPPY